MADTQDLIRQELEALWDPDDAVPDFSEWSERIDRRLFRARWNGPGDGRPTPAEDAAAWRRAASAMAQETSTPDGREMLARCLRAASALEELEELEELRAEVRRLPLKLAKSPGARELIGFRSEGLWADEVPLIAALLRESP